MASREIRVFEVREVLRLWLRGEGYRSIAELAQVDRKTVRRYLEAAEAVGLTRDDGGGHGDERLSDELLGRVVERVRTH
jgi:transposase